MLVAFIREYWGASNLINEIVVDLDEAINSPIRIGRSAELKKYRIGQSFIAQDAGTGATVAALISRVQATIVFNNETETFTLWDGTQSVPSKSGVYVYGQERIDRSIELCAGQKLSLFRSLPAEITLSVTDDSAANRDTRDGTYTPEDLVEVLHTRLGMLGEEMRQLKEEVTPLRDGQKQIKDQIAIREEIDKEQATTIEDLKNRLKTAAETIEELQKRFRKAMIAILIIGALLSAAIGLSKEWTAEDRKEWRTLVIDLIKTLTVPTALGAGAVYLKSTENK